MGAVLTKNAIQLLLEAGLQLPVHALGIPKAICRPDPTPLLLARAFVPVQASMKCSQIRWEPMAWLQGMGQGNTRGRKQFAFSVPRPCSWWGFAAKRKAEGGMP